MIQNSVSTRELTISKDRRGKMVVTSNVDVMTQAVVFTPVSRGIYRGYVISVNVKYIDCVKRDY